MSVQQMLRLLSIWSPTRTKSNCMKAQPGKQMTARNNKLRAIRFQRPDYIPMSFRINSACWHHYDQNALQDLMELHPFLFPDFRRQEQVSPQFGLTQRKDEPYTDPWGCIWETTEN
ncbi:MAG TPA: hypothetical protein ENL03_03265 [Phycisphaerae bacterium]|nr:hypothetical protein [Phycisphaerae bacterium]